MLADDRRVADLPVADPQLVVGEADGARIVRALGQFQRPRQERDAAGRLAAGERDSPVHAPEIRQSGGIQPLTAFGLRAERRGGLFDIVLKQPGLGEGGPDWARSSSRDRSGCFQRTNQQIDSFFPVPLFQGPNGRPVRSCVMGRR